jgi:hypothetical protein
LHSMAVAWMNTVAEVADGVVCLTRTAVDELYQWLDLTKPQRLQPLSLGFFHFVTDSQFGLPSLGPAEEASWQESSRQLADLVLGRRWTSFWPHEASWNNRKEADNHARDSDTANKSD